MKNRILVLEDDRTSRKLLTMTLEKAGYDVIECSEGKDAIHITMMYPPKVIVADVMLPDMTGTEVVELLKKQPSCKYMKTIFLTGLLSKKESNLKLKFKFEVDGLHYRALSKPVRKSTLLNLLKELIAQSDAERKRDEATVAKAEAKAKAEAAAKAAAREAARKAKKEEDEGNLFAEEPENSEIAI